MSDPILASYAEQHVQLRREFFLYADRVVVRAHWRVKGDFENTVDLRTLKDEPRSVVIRNKWYRYAGWILAAGAMVSAISVYNRSGQIGGAVTWAGLVVAVLGLALMGATRRKILFARFDAREGRGGVDIACTGDKETFDAFVQSIRRQIRKQDR